MAKKLKYDEIGYWSEIKLDIIREYAAVYSKILCGQKKYSFHHIYIDAFAGAGQHISKNTGEFVLGSPSNALLIVPPFKEFHFIDLNKLKIESLENLSGNRPDVHLYEGDCNQVLLEEVLPHVKYEQFKRALCVLDPYGLHLNWEVILKIGQMQSIEIFLNFPVADINRNVLWRNRGNVPSDQIDRMNLFWGDDSWQKVAYQESKQKTLWGEPDEEKSTNDQIAEAFRQRLMNVASFKRVPQPIAMRNTQNAIVYYLFFASQNPVAENIVKDIFKKYENRRG